MSSAWRHASMLERATQNTPEATPGVLVRDIVQLTLTGEAAAHAIVEQLVAIIASQVQPRPHTLSADLPPSQQYGRSGPSQAAGRPPWRALKALRLLAHCLQQGHSSVRVWLVRHTGVLAAASSHQGLPDALRGDADHAAVRDAALTLLDQLHGDDVGRVALAERTRTDRDDIAANAFGGGDGGWGPARSTSSDSSRPLMSRLAESMVWLADVIDGGDRHRRAGPSGSDQGRTGRAPGTSVTSSASSLSSNDRRWSTPSTGDRKVMSPDSGHGLYARIRAGSSATDPTAARRLAASRPSLPAWSPSTESSLNSSIARTYEFFEKPVEASAAGARLWNSPPREGGLGVADATSDVSLLDERRRERLAGRRLDGDWSAASAGGHSVQDAMEPLQRVPTEFPGRRDVSIGAGESATVIEAHSEYAPHVGIDTEWTTSRAVTPTTPIREEEEEDLDSLVLATSTDCTRQAIALLVRPMADRRPFPPLAALDQFARAMRDCVFDPMKAAHALTEAVASRSDWRRQLRALAVMHAMLVGGGADARDALERVAGPAVRVLRSDACAASVQFLALRLPL